MSPPSRKIHRRRSRESRAGDSHRGAAAGRSPGWAYGRDRGRRYAIISVGADVVGIPAVAALIGRSSRGSASANSRTGRRQRHGIRRSAVVLQSAEVRIDRAAAGADLIAIGTVSDSRHTRAIADQIVGTSDGDRSTNVWITRCRVASHNGVEQCQCTEILGIG